MQEDTKSTLIKKLREHHLKPLKSLGQNFLVDNKAIQSIVSAIQKYDSPFVEIGPGLGALTDHFKKDSLCLVEKDKKLASYWQNKSHKVLCQDALDLTKDQVPKNFVLFGNLPYEIAASLIIKMTIEDFDNKVMIFLMQKEVADRIKSPCSSKNYGLLSVISQVYWEVHSLIKIPKHKFYPIPQVSGQVLEFKRKNTIPIPPLPFFHFVKKSFHMRRKMLYKKLPLPEPKKTLEGLGLSNHCRAEDLSPENFVKLFKKTLQ